MTDPVVAILAQQALKKEECWINVYELNGKVWLGNCHKERYKSELVIRHIIYRIHVRLK